MNCQTIIVASDCGNYHEEIPIDEARTRFECGVITREQWVWSQDLQDWEPARSFFEKLRNQAKKASQRLMAVIEQTQRRAASYRQSNFYAKSTVTENFPSSPKEKSVGRLLTQLFGKK